MATNEIEEPEDPGTVDQARDLIEQHLLAPTYATGDLTLGSIILVLIVLAMLTFTPQPYGLLGTVCLVTVVLRLPRSRKVVVSSPIDRDKRSQAGKKGD